MTEMYIIKHDTPIANFLNHPKKKNMIDISNLLLVFKLIRIKYNQPTKIIVCDKMIHLIWSLNMSIGNNKIYNT